MKSYAEKLKDPRWQKKRLEVLNRDNWTCVLCENSKEELHVHHEKYYGEPWDVDLKDLKTCCWVCHSAITYLKKIDINFELAIAIKHNGLESNGYNCWILGCAREFAPYMIYVTVPHKGTGDPWTMHMRSYVKFHDDFNWMMSQLSSKYWK